MRAGLERSTLGAKGGTGAVRRGRVMRKALTGVFALVAACGIRAQEAATPVANAAVSFRETSGAQVKLVAFNADSNAIGGAPVETSASAAQPEAALPAAAPEPAANPKYIFGNRDDYRFQLGIGFEFFRFRSSVFDANLIGINTSLAYYTNSWFGVEGNVIAAFSTGTIDGGGHAKVAGGLGGLRIGSRRAKWEPWAHGLVGGGHLQPQTALGSRSGLMAVGGGGVDYRVHARLSFRAEADWVYSGFFNSTQNNFQVMGGAVLHF